MKNLVFKGYLLFLVFSGFGCGSSNHSDPVPNTRPAPTEQSSGATGSRTTTTPTTPIASTTSWQDTAMYNLVQNRCAICHRSYATVSEASMKSNTSALRMVNSGRMPQGSKLSAEELATFQNFYN